MGVFNSIRKFILSLFGKRTIDEYADERDERYKQRFEDTTRISFESIFANALAVKAVSDSGFSVKDATGKDSRRSEWIEEGLKQIWEKNVAIVSQALGKGGKVLIPYIINGRPYVDAIEQSRMVISETRGTEITSATFWAGTVNVGGKLYYRFVDYTLYNRVHTIRNRATNENGAEVPLEMVQEWASIAPEITINGVDHLLFGYLKCPKDSREDNQVRGVPITFGSGEIIQDLYTCLDDMKREYRLKQPFVGADERLFGKDSKLPDNGLFKKFQQSGLKDGSFWEVYDPAIRDSSYMARYNQLCALLESSIGVSPGILTEPRTANATATEIKAANAATFSMINLIRQNIERAFEQVAYALDVLAEFSGATPGGDLGNYQITWDWDYSMMESSTETFTQLSELESRGLILSERLNAWVTGQNEEAAKKEIELVKAQQIDTIDNLLTD